MFAAIFITLIVVAALGLALRPDRRTTVHRPYNNRYSDAVGARDGRLN